MPVFTCKFSATKLIFGRKAKVGSYGTIEIVRTKKIVEKFSVKARDQYEAMEKIIAKIGKSYNVMTNPVFQFGKTKGLMSKQVSDAVNGAGPEES